MGIVTSLAARTTALLRRTGWAGCGFTQPHLTYLEEIRGQLARQYGQNAANWMMERYALLCREFPCLAGKIRFRVEPNERNALALATFDDTVILAPTRVRDDVNRRYLERLPEDTMKYRDYWESVISHELGHMLERELIQRRVRPEAGETASCFPLRDRRVRQWNRHVQAARLIRKACDLTREECPELRLRSNDELVAGVSDYARTNRSEALAECVSVYSGSRMRSDPLSIRVWRLLKEELGKN